LLVELTLIQVAQLTTEGDDVSGGRSPKQTIKTVFSQPAAAQPSQVASASSVQQAPVHSSPLITLRILDRYAQAGHLHHRNLSFLFGNRRNSCARLPKEQVAIAKRMQVLRPVLLNNSTTFEIVVDNEIAAKDFTAATCSFGN